VRDGTSVSKRRTETLVADIQVPKVDSEIVGGDVCLLVRVDGYGVYVVRMSVGVDFTWDCGDDVVLLRHAGKSEVIRRCGWG
jgi:hypothetical protein